MRPAGWRAPRRVRKEAAQIRLPAIAILLVLIAVAVVIGVRGCGYGAMRVPGDAASEDTEGDDQLDVPRVLIEGPIFEGFDESGATVWRAQADSTSVEVTDEIAMGEIKGLDGEILQEGALASAFTAGRGYADEQTQALVLYDGVEVVSDELGVTLRAERLRWDSSTEKIVAEGTVTVTSDVHGLRSGPFEEIWATPDLSQVATPDMFSQPSSSAAR